MDKNNSILKDCINEDVISSLNTNNHIGEEIRQLCLKTRAIAERKISQIQKINEWRVLQVEFSNKNICHFGAVVFEKGKKVVICFAGTNPQNYKDQAANVKMGLLDIPTKQMEAAKNFTKKIKEEYKKQKFSLTLAGHSEGGSEAIYCGLLYDIPTFTYNSFFLGNKTLSSIVKERNGKLFNQELITNYRNNLDPVSKLINNDIGITYIVENPNRKYKITTPLGTIKAHPLENMGNCTQGVLKEIYMQNNQEFLDKFLNLKLTNNVISNIKDFDLWNLTEPEIINKIKNNDFHVESDLLKGLKSGNYVFISNHSIGANSQIDGFFKTLTI